MKTSEICGNERRREDSRASQLNGLDYLEVSDDQCTLTVYFLDKAPAKLMAENLRILGGRRVRDLKITKVEINRVYDAEQDDSMEITLDRPGDFSTYTLQIQNDPKDREDRLLEGFDPRYTELEFSCKASCPSDLDCRAEDICPPVVRAQPEINYFAKDYASFRQLILDRMRLIMPGWQERHVPDLGITLVELLAYVGDHLSYHQDAVGTEAYLSTARQRISVRRHARLVDYFVHEGCNARAWVCVEVSGKIESLQPGDFFFITRLNHAGFFGKRVLKQDDIREIPQESYEVFEPLAANYPSVLQWRRDHNRIRFYTWGDQECCLPRGSTSVTLCDEWRGERTLEKKTDSYSPGKPPPDCADDAAPPPKKTARERALDLRVGDVLIFEEVIGPKTGNPADADPLRRQAVRLTKVKLGVDPLYEGPDGRPVVQIEWAAEDALMFAFCLSVIGPPHDCKLLHDVSVARGNVVLVDHGAGQEREDLDPVETESTEVTCEGECRPSEVTVHAATFRPTLKHSPLTFAQPLPAHHKTPASARRLLLQDPRLALPRLGLRSGGADPAGAEWVPRRDLLESGPDDPHFVVETDDERRTHLRFGDDELGRMPDAGTVFTATYRVGNGTVGNVGAEAISHLVLRKGALDGVTVRNPLPALGGTAPEPLEDVRLSAPRAFRKELQRAITADDYAQIVLREFSDRVQRAVAALRWTGSWYEVLVAIDPIGSEDVPAALLKEIERRLYPYRKMGHDLRIVPARYVPLELALDICVQPHRLRAHVKAALLNVFGAGLTAGGETGFFHPDRLTFGQGIYLSRIVAAAQRVAGVESVTVTKLQRRFADPDNEIENGVLPLGLLEVARLDNDRGNPENGVLTLNLGGGR